MHTHTLSLSLSLSLCVCVLQEEVPWTDLQRMPCGERQKERQREDENRLQSTAVWRMTFIGTGRSHVMPFSVKGWLWCSAGGGASASTTITDSGSSATGRVMDRCCTRQKRRPFVFSVACSATALVGKRIHHCHDRQVP
jgi:hypothetical protein